MRRIISAVLHWMRLAFGPRLPWHEAQAAVRRAELAGLPLDVDRNSHDMQPCFRTADGWLVWIYNDNGDWHYVAAVEAPDGRAWGPNPQSSEPGWWQETPSAEVLDRVYRWSAVMRMLGYG